MPIGLMDFPLLTPEQAAPRRTSMTKAVEALLNASSARYNFARSAEQEAKNPYVGRQTLADVINKEITNKYLPREKESEIGLRGAQASHYGMEDKVTDYKLKHGGYDPDFEQTMRYLQSMNQNQNNNKSAPNETDRVNYELQNLANDLPNNIASKLTMPEVNLQKPSIAIPGMADRINQIYRDNIVPESLDVGKTPDMPQAQAGMPQQQQQQQAPQQQQMIPGTNISLRDAMEAAIKHKLGISNVDPARQEYLNGMLELAKKREKASAFRALPPAAREADISTVAPMVGGYTNAARELMNGKTPEEIAASKGFDPNARATWPVPAPPPSKPVITQQQKANIARNAREAVQQRITDNLGFYPEKILGYNPKMIADLLQGKNADQAGKTLAAIFMNNEENALMARGMGVQAGLGMIKMMNAKSLGDLGVPGFLQSKELLDSFRREVRLYNNIMIGNENNTLNAMYRLENPINAEHERTGSNAVSNEFTNMSEEELNSIIAGGA